MLSRIAKNALFRGSFRGLANAASQRTWRVYLSGEIHTDWYLAALCPPPRPSLLRAAYAAPAVAAPRRRDQIAAGVLKRQLPIELSGPNTSHADSDDCGAIILGMEEKRPNWDAIGARMNAIRTKTLITEADVVVVRFGEKYRQWNAAFEAGYASALGKPIITQHPPAISHMLKEVNAGALAVCEDVEQVLDTLDYTITGRLPAPRDGDAFVPIVDRLGKGNPAP